MEDERVARRGLEQAVAPREASALAIAATRAIGAELVGVDLLPLPGCGYTVLELNGAVEFDARYSLPGADVYMDVADALGLEAVRPSEALARPTAAP